MMRVIGDLLKALRFHGSRDYWAKRYARGGNSGAGSYGRYAEFKASVINRLAAAEGIESVVELGCGDGHQATLFEVPRYVGLDVAPGAVEISRQRLEQRAGFECHLYEPAAFEPAASGFRSDAALSLDVIFHLVEDPVYRRYLTHLFGLAERFVIIYSSNKNTPRMFTRAHVRHRRFVDDVAVLAPAFELFEHVPNPYPSRFMGIGGSFADFYIYRRSITA